MQIAEMLAKMAGMEKDHRKVKCPFCGYEMPIYLKENAKCYGVFVRCKGRGCKKIFEILTK